jgi:hypothetical protein
VARCRGACEGDAAVIAASTVKELLDWEHQRKVSEWGGFGLLTVVSFGTFPPVTPVCVVAGVLAAVGVLHLIMVLLQAILWPNDWSISDL